MTAKVLKLDLLVDKVTFYFYIEYGSWKVLSIYYVSASCQLSNLVVANYWWRYHYKPCWHAFLTPKMMYLFKTGALWILTHNVNLCIIAYHRMPDKMGFNKPSLKHRVLDMMCSPLLQAVICFFQLFVIAKKHVIVDYQKKTVFCFTLYSTIMSFVRFVIVGNRFKQFAWSINSQ